MLIRMTPGTGLTSLLVAGALAAGGAVGSAASDSPAAARRAAIVVDASLGRSGSALVDPRLAAAHADVRLPRTASEASADVRYFAARAYGLVVVAGPMATAAARRVDIPVRRVPGVAAAVAATRPHG